MARHTAESLGPGKSLVSHAHQVHYQNISGLVFKNINFIEEALPSINFGIVVKIMNSKGAFLPTNVLSPHDYTSCLPCLQVCSIPTDHCSALTA